MVSIVFFLKMGNFEQRGRDMRKTRRAFAFFLLGLGQLFSLCPHDRSERIDAIRRGRAKLSSRGDWWKIHDDFSAVGKDIHAKTNQDSLGQ